MNGGDPTMTDGLTDAAKAEIAEAFRILKEDKTDAWYRKMVAKHHQTPPTDPKPTDPPTDPKPTDPPKPPPPPVKDPPTDPPPEPKKRGIWWGEDE